MFLSLLIGLLIVGHSGDVIAAEKSKNSSCIYSGNPKIVKLNGEDCSSNLCVGEVECLRAGVAVVYQVSCVAQKGDLCPTVQDCINDDSASFKKVKKNIKFNSSDETSSHPSSATTE